MKNMGTVSDVLSFLLKMDEQLDMNFEAEKNEKGSTKSVGNIFLNKPEIRNKNAIAAIPTPIVLHLIYPLTSFLTNDFLHSHR